MRWLDETTVPVWLLLLIIAVLILSVFARWTVLQWQRERCRVHGHDWRLWGDELVRCRRCKQTTAQFHRGGGRGRRV